MKLEIYSDGASRGNPGLAGAGGIVFLDKKEVATVSQFLGETTNNVAEYRALILTLYIAQDYIKSVKISPLEAEIFADSELMIKQLRGEYQVRNEVLKPLFLEARQLLSYFQKIKLTHIPRELNSQADRLSNEAINNRPYNHSVSQPIDCGELAFVLLSAYVPNTKPFQTVKSELKKKFLPLIFIKKK